MKILIISAMLISFGYTQKSQEISMDEFIISAGAFENGDTIPSLYTCEGKDISPSLTWDNIPDNTKSFALTCVDPDAPMGDWIHWIVWDIPHDWKSLTENILGTDQDQFVQGTNSWGRIGYGGPCPPQGHGAHRYYFTLYALDKPSLELKSGTRIQGLKEKITDHILGQSVVMGRYERK
jgi:Raf kinase inhibitor-like YbhB/YbcL family protein